MGRLSGGERNHEITIFSIDKILILRSILKRDLLRSAGTSDYRTHSARELLTYPYSKRLKSYSTSEKENYSFGERLIGSPLKILSQRNRQEILCFYVQLFDEMKRIYSLEQYFS
jgi:hypothetical protein